MSSLGQPLLDGRNKVDAARQWVIVQLLLLHPFVVWACQLLTFAVLDSLEDIYFACAGYRGAADFIGPIPKPPDSYPSVLQRILSPPPASWDPPDFWVWIANPWQLSTCQAAFTLLCSWLVWFCAVKRSGCCCPACIVVFACLYFLGVLNPLLTAPILAATSETGCHYDPDDQAAAAWEAIRVEQLMTLGIAGTIPTVIEVIYSVCVGVALLKYRCDLGDVPAVV